MNLTVWLLAASSLLQNSEAEQVFRYDAEAPLDFQVASEEARDGFIVQDVSYRSARQGGVPAYLVKPAGEGPFSLGG